MKNYNGINTKICLVLILLVATLGQGWAQEIFPNKPVKIIVSWEPGGGMDLNARTLQPLVEKNLGQPVVIVNKPGAAGTIGFTEGAKALPDGYTVTLVNTSISTTPYLVSPTISYRNYEPIIFTGIVPGAVTVRLEAPWKSLKEFFDYARANPGKIRMSNAGHGSSTHIRTVGIELTGGVRFTHVPYKGSGPALTSLVGGHVEGTAAAIAETIHLAKGGGRLRVLAITAAERMPAIPDVPTFKELGMDFENGGWHSYAVPKGTPKERIKILHDAFKKAMESREYIEYANNQAVMAIYLGPEDLLKFWDKEEKAWFKLIEAAGLKKAQ